MHLDALALLLAGAGRTVLRRTQCDLVLGRLPVTRAGHVVLELRDLRLRLGERPQVGQFGTGPSFLWLVGEILAVVGADEQDAVAADAGEDVGPLEPRPEVRTAHGKFQLAAAR
jgi:hypothetical protein